MNIITDYYAKQSLALFEKYQLFPDFGWEGEEGFGLLWVLRQAAGVSYPFGKVLCIAPGEYVDQYIAVFSRKTMKPLEKRICYTEKYLSPGLIIRGDAFSLEWVTDNSLYGTRYFRHTIYEDMPQSARNRMLELLGKDYPFSPQAQRALGI